MKYLALATLSAMTLGFMGPGVDAIPPINLASLAPDSSTFEAVQIAMTPGQFVTVEQAHPTTGTVSLLTENGATYLIFDDAFTTAQGPQVEVVLYTESAVPVTLEAADYVTIAALQSFEGAQRYLIPADIDVDTYNAVAIWCRQFNVTFGYAPL